MIRSKQSQLLECLATSSGVLWGDGREAGTPTDEEFFTDQTSGRVPSEPARLEAALPADLETLAGWAQRLRRSLLSAWAGDPREVAVRVVEALVVETDSRGSRQSRCLRTAQFLLGADHAAPIWTRTIPFVDLERPWPSPVLEAVARWSAESAVKEGEPPRFDVDPPDGPWVLDLFAAADMIRVEASRWLKGDLAWGTTVGSEAVSLEDPGEFGAPAGALDAHGDLQRPFASVQRGKLIAVPTDATEIQAASGSRRLGSWRHPARLEWRSLRWSSPISSGGWPAEAWVITRVLFVRSALLVSGHRREGRHVVSRWGPRLGPRPAWWLNQIGSTLPDAAPDATGWPVVVPPLRLGPPR